VFITPNKKHNEVIDSYEIRQRREAFRMNHFDKLLIFSLNYKVV